MKFQKMHPPTPPEKFTDTAVFLQFLGGRGGTRVFKKSRGIWKNSRFLWYEFKTRGTAAKRNASFETWT